MDNYRKTSSKDPALIESLSKIDFGQVLVAKAWIQLGNGPYFLPSAVFVIKEYSHVIKSWPDYCPIELRTGLIPVKNCMVAAVLFSLPYNKYYETYFNYHDAVASEIMHYLQVQPEIYVDCYNEHNELIKTMSTPNTIKEFFVFAENFIKAYCLRWTDKDFAEALLELRTAYTVQRLWDRLGSQQKHSDNGNS